jgi:hypothetical protein
MPNAFFASIVVSGWLSVARPFCVVVMLSSFRGNAVASS